MKQTPIQKAIAEIEAEMKIWESQSPSPERGALLWSKHKLQSLLDYEQKCIIDSWDDGLNKGYTGDRGTAHDYFTNTFKTNPQGGGVE